MHELETDHFHGRVKRNYVHLGISARRSNVETHLCDKKMPCSTYQTQNDFEFLQAAVYGVHLGKQILQEHDVDIDKIYHWTDPSTILNRLQSAHKKQQVFFANRAAEILENSSTDQLRHVKGIQNPADIGTKVMSIEGHNVFGWINGPA